MRILFIRDGETETNIKGSIHKTGDSVNLNKKGNMQAQKLVKV